MPGVRTATCGSGTQGQRSQHYAGLSPPAMASVARRSGENRKNSSFLPQADGTLPPQTARRRRLHGRPSSSLASAGVRSSHSPERLLPPPSTRAHARCRRLCLRPWSPRGHPVSSRSSDWALVALSRWPDNARGGRPALCAHPSHLPPPPTPQTTTCAMPPRRTCRASRRATRCVRCCCTKRGVHEANPRTRSVRGRSAWVSHPAASPLHSLHLLPLSQALYFAGLADVLKDESKPEDVRTLAGIMLKTALDAVVRGERGGGGEWGRGAPSCVRAGPFCARAHSAPTPRLPPPHRTPA